MKINLIVVPLLMLGALSGCSNQTNNEANSRTLDSTKAKSQNGKEQISIDSIMVSTTTLLRSHNVDVNNDRGFAEMIMYYNHAAIDLSDAIIKESKNVELKKFVKENISKRNNEMNEMSAFLQREPEDKSPSSKDFQNAVNSAIVKINDGSFFSEKNIDKKYLLSMITLQQCASDIAEAELRYGSHQTLKIHARNIVSAGGEEIEGMQERLKKIK